MRILLDTHTVIWFLEGDSRLSHTARATIENLENERLISIVSCWEMAIKISIGKLEINKSLEEIFQAIGKNNIQLMPISPKHAMKVSQLPFYHKDPFDRMILSQAITENISLISRDQNFSQYPVNVIW